LWRNWWNEEWQGKPKYSEKTCPSAILSTTNPTRLDPDLNPSRRGGKPATNRLSYGVAIIILLLTFASHHVHKKRLRFAYFFFWMGFFTIAHNDFCVILYGLYVLYLTQFIIIETNGSKCKCCGTYRTT
jgi:hypothetical protein